MTLPPGPSLPPLVQSLLWFRRPEEFLTECRKRYGDVFTVRLAGFGTGVMIAHPPTVKEIFTGDPNVLHAGEAAQSLRPVLGDFSLLALDGREHLRQRRLMLPSFHGERMQQYARTMAEITGRVVSEWPMGEPFALHPHMQRITLEVILRTVFGVDEGERFEELRGAITQLLASGEDPIMQLFFFLQFRPRSGRRVARFERRLARVDDLIYAEIARRRRQTDGSRTDVLAMLLEARDDEGRPMSDVELRDELMTLLVAGHETTASSLCWAIERILGTPSVYARLLAELDDVLGGGPLDSDRLGALPYLDATVREVLRLRPIIPMVGRVLQRPMTIRGWDIPPGAVLLPSIYLTHREPDLYPDPDTLRPERFLDRRPDPYAWFPFGGGVRRCLGMAFAMYEMRVVLAGILSRVDLSIAQPAPVPTVRRGITFVPERGVVVRAEPRSKRADAEAGGRRDHARPSALPP